MVEGDTALTFDYIDRVSGNAMVELMTRGMTCVSSELP